MIKSAFLLVAWYVVPRYVGPMHPSSYLYFEASILVGTFLAGFSVGYHFRDTVKGALAGLLSSATGTGIVSMLIVFDMYHIMDLQMFQYIFSDLILLDISEVLHVSGLGIRFVRFPVDLFAMLGAILGSIWPIANNGILLETHAKTERILPTRLIHTAPV